MVHGSEVHGSGLVMVNPPAKILYDGQSKENQSIRILRIIARLNIGGPAIQAITLSSDLNKAIYKTLLVCGNVSPYEGDMAYLAEERGVQPYILPELGREISPIGDLHSLTALRKTIQQFRPHIIHTHTAKAGTLGRLAVMNMR